MKFFFSSLICSIAFLNGIAQVGSDSASSFIMVGTDYSTNISSHGQVNDTYTQPSASGYVSWYAPFNVDVSLIGLNIWNSDSTFTKSSQELDLILGYTYSITNWLEARVDYSKYFYSQNSKSIRSNYSDLASFSLSTDFEWFWANLNCGYSIGDYEEFFASTQTGMYFSFDDVIKKGHAITIQPSIELRASLETIIDIMY